METETGLRGISPVLPSSFCCVSIIFSVIRDIELNMLFDISCIFYIKPKLGKCHTSIFQFCFMKYLLTHLWPLFLLTWISFNLSIDMPNKMWIEITCLFPNYNGAAVEVWNG